MREKYGLRMYVVSAIEGFKLDNLPTDTLVGVQQEAVRIAAAGLWRTDYEYIPPSQIRSILVTRL